ncbi:hypothetical protein NLU13_4376 [Sarocladium strictum]|uniref:Fringe-like glycosyltransferase domain-containing protein n=1 Tax=Sarocladium strictum TaxID=5046 RepID=A0AA39GJ36_SARSR|nr:hypothetical protein NLU13_4376 [Sarocladium strictum]
MRVIFTGLVVLLLYLGYILQPFSLGREHPVSIPLESKGHQYGHQQTLSLPSTAHTQNSPGTGQSAVRHLDCSIDRKHLSSVQQRYGLEDKFRYLKRYIRFHRKPELERKSMTQIPHPFLASEFRTIDIRKEQPKIKCDAPLELDVSDSGFPFTVDASMFMFGVSTTYARLLHADTTPIEEWLFWLTDGYGHSNGAKLILTLLDANDTQLQEVANLLCDAGVDVDVYHSESSMEMAVRYLSLIPTLYNHSQATEKSWLVLCDDDTFFPFMHKLVERFQTYDSSVPTYIGTLSEDVFSVERHGSHAFGGGGIFLSRSLAGIITDLFDSCTTRDKVHESDTGWGPQGDILLRKCIYENTDVRLKTIWDLWQLDITGDAAGFYEWGKQPLSVHHYRGGDWTNAKPVEFTKIAYICGEDCILQRFMTQDGFLISGHSVSYYPDGTGFDWDMVERTMDAMPQDKGWNLDFMFGPQRPSLSRTGKKVAWDLQESQLGEDGSVRQTYTRRWDDWRWMYPDDSPMSNLDGILELIWIPV